MNSNQKHHHGGNEIYYGVLASVSVNLDNPSEDEDEEASKVAEDDQGHGVGDISVSGPIPPQELHGDESKRDISAKGQVDQPSPPGP